MAINPETQYPGKITPGDANYPYGSARNVTVPGDGTGTPWEAALLNEVFGSQQALLSQAGIVPSGSPDTALDSQYLKAQAKLFGINYDNVSAALSGKEPLGSHVGTIAYYAGWAALTYGPQGGARYLVVDKATHDVVRGTALVDERGDHTRADGNILLLLAANGFVNVRQFGARGDAVTSDSDAFDAGIDFLEGQARPGGILGVPSGSYFLTRMFRVGGFCSVVGTSPFSSSLVFDPAYTIGNCIELGPDQSGAFGHSGSYAFGSRLMQIDVNANNTYRGAGAAVVYTVGAHQPSGLVRCQIRNFLSTGVHYDVGLGGPAGFNLTDVNFQGSALAPTLGDKVGVLTSAGGAQVNLTRVQVESDNTNPFDAGVRCDKDHLTAIDTHYEGCAIGILAAQAEAIDRNVAVMNATGHSTTPVLVQRSSSHVGKFTVVNAYNESLATTGLVVVNDLKTGFQREDGTVDLYSGDSYTKSYRPLQPFVTIAAGIIAISGSYHAVDTEAAAATDDLDTINGHIDGDILTLRRQSITRTVVIKHGTGNINTKTAADVTLTTREQTISFVYDAQLLVWIEI